ncbi:MULTISPECIES: helix-turn-helix domain-containing protein [Streptomyces]|uniref:Helix-turn-helix domain-containing protein n=1 Tax=Streptomyces edwardsiae TaxID=3075527 RepID=A0ABU2Q165_9ACTN|nr:helix-turn-helix domain-containing protein [Streptomyces sp. DSM 41636]MDT0398171.1 helix-turn-helix domain-containing protein [Streptomyces sp. DSM 41636]
MGTQNPSAPPRAQTRNAGSNRPQRTTTGGLHHDNSPHTARFTVIGNHLAQHSRLSLLTIGLGTHLQSLPKGAPADIKSLTARFPEGAARIAAALRELECHGYLRRERHRTATDRIVSRTVSCNQPTAARPHPEPPAAPEPREEPEREPENTCEQPRARKPLPAVPRPECTVPAVFKTAADLLAGLHRHNPQLLLSTADAAHLTPGVAAWLERDVSSAAVRRALTADLPPEGVRRPAAFLAHRLAAQLPPPAPYGREPAVPPPPARHSLQNCDGCDRAFRAPHPGRCRACRTDIPEAA